MQMIYGCSTCSDTRFREIEKKYHISAGHAIQKYHALLMRGLAENGVRVKCISSLPINRSVTPKKLIRERDEHEMHTDFHYIRSLNLPLLRQLTVFFGAFFSALRVKKTEDTFAMIDSLSIACAYGVSLACRLRRIPVASLVTDLPEMEFHSSFLHKACGRLYKKSDAFILLTEQMNGRVNHNGRPYVVLEGHVDADAPLPQRETPYEQSEGIKAVLYAGSLKKIYGIAALVQGFLEAQLPDTQLWVYGSGDFRGELEEMARENPGIKYLGVTDNREIVAQEQRAALLVNPRPAAPEYTRYSFPSKNMEYMVSGTPVLTTVLPGMPEEYCPYVYLLEDETPEGISEALRRILALPYEERVKKGRAAREFVLQNKTNVIQAKKIIRFFQQMPK